MIYYLVILNEENIMKLQDFSTLAEAQAYEKTETAFISKSTMSLYMRAAGLYLLFYKLAEGKMDTDGDHPAKETAFMVTKALESGNADNKDFNFIIGHPFGDANLAELDNLINTHLTEYAAQLTTLKALVQGHCNKVVRPFKYATQAELDLAKFVPAEVEATYPSETYIITTGTQGIDCEIASDKDCVATVYLSVSNEDGNPTNFVKYETPVGVVSVKNGRGILTLSSRKVRTYNRLCVVANNDATLSMTVKANRG